MNEKMKQLLNKANSVAQTASSVAGKGIDAASKKSSEIAQSAKLSKKVFDLENDINGLLQTLGKMVYDTHKGIEVDAGSLDELLTEVDGKYAEKDEAQSQLDQLKSTKKCPTCGATVSRDDKFCSGCGESLN